MLERDYIRRLIRQFFEELEKLRDKQRNDAYSSTYQCEVNSMYRAYLGHPASFFTNKTLNLYCRHWLQNFLLSKLCSDWRCWPTCYILMLPVPIVQKI